MRKLLWTRKSRKIRIEETSEKFCRKVLPVLLSLFCVKQMKADRPLLEPVMTRVSASSKVSWGLHSTRYVQQQPTWSPGVAGRCPGPRAILRARQRHGLTPTLLLSSPGIQRTWASNTFFRIFPQIEEILRISLKKERMNSFASFSFTELTD